MSLTASDDDNERQTDVPVPSGEDAIQDKLALEEVLKALPKKDQTLIRLRYFKGLTPKCDSQKTRNVTGARFQEKERAVLAIMRKKADGRLFSVGNIGSDSKRDTETVGKLSAFFNILFGNHIDHRKTQILTVLFTLFCKFDDGVKRFFTECRSTQLTVFFAAVFVKAYRDFIGIFT